MARHLRELARALPARGFACSFAGPEKLPQALRDDASGAAPRTHTLDLRDRPSVLADIRAGLRLTRLLREESPRLLHAHGYRAAWVASLASRGPARLVVTAHNLFPEGAGRLARAALRRAVSQADGVLAISQAVLESVRRGIAPRRVTPAEPPPLPCPKRVVPNGVRPAPLPDRGDSRRALGLSEDRWTVLVMGRFIGDKGIDLALQAAGHLGSDVSLLVAGDGPDRPRLEHLLRELRLSDRVTLLGWRENILLLLAACDAVLVPSRREGQSLTALEAMAAGKAVVASAVGGLRETVEDGATGLLAPLDPKAMAAALARLREDPALAAALGSAAQDFVLRHRTVEAMVDATAEFYRQVLGC